MLQLKYHALAGRKLLQRSGDARSQLSPQEIALRIRSRAHVRHLVEQIVLAARRILRDRRILFAHVLFAQVIETQVGHNPVNPGVEGTLEPETADVFVSLEEGVLVDVLRVLLGPGEMESQAQHRLVVVTHEFLEGAAVSPLSLSDQHRVIDTAFLPSHAAPRGVLVPVDSLYSITLLLRVGPAANRYW